MNQNQQFSANSQKINFNLDATELMFFPNCHDGTPAVRVPSFGADLQRKTNYLEKIKNMSGEQRRKHRKDRDLRYLHKKATKEENVDAEKDEESKKLCLYHLTGHCNRNQCYRIHQMRIPRIFGVCKFYLTGTCTKGDFCEYMHSDFPCRFHYLNMEHPKQATECRFSHGGPLPQKLKDFFLKHIEHWVKERTKNNPNEFENQLNEFIDKYNIFEANQIMLASESCQTNQSTECMEQHEEQYESFLHSVLSNDKVKRLKEQNITTTAQICRTPVDKLEELGLTMDEIYEITIKSSSELEHIVESSDVSSETDKHEVEILQNIDEVESSCSSKSDFPGFPSEIALPLTNSFQSCDLRNENKIETNKLPSDEIDVLPSTSQSSDADHIFGTISESDDSDSEALIINEN